MRFESPAEREAYPILNTISIEYKLGFDFQCPVGYQYGGYSSKEEWCRDNGKYYNGKEDDWNNSSWESELYRIDFVLTTDYIRLAIEIDGEKYHQNEDKEKRRDDFLKSRGFDVLHVPAKMVLFDKYNFKQLVLRELEIIK